MKIKDLPLDDRPREKLILRGSQSLSDSELLAIILRTGTKGKSVVQMAQEIMNKNGNLATFATKSVSAFTKDIGIGKDKAATLAAVFEIAKRVNAQIKWFSEITVTAPEDIAKIFIPLLKDELKEQFFVICLNSANRIIKYESISVGNLNSSIVHAREVFKVAIDNNSANIIVLHNHPSGNPDPSNEDVAVTKKLVEGGRILGIEIFDHIIIAGNQFVSFVQKRLI